MLSNCSAGQKNNSYYSNTEWLIKNQSLISAQHVACTTWSTSTVLIIKQSFTIKSHNWTAQIVSILKELWWCCVKERKSWRKLNWNQGVKRVRWAFSLVLFGPEVETSAVTQWSEAASPLNNLTLCKVSRRVAGPQGEKTQRNPEHHLKLDALLVTDGLLNCSTNKWDAHLLATSHIRDVRDAWEGMNTVQCLFNTPRDFGLQLKLLVKHQRDAMTLQTANVTTVEPISKSIKIWLQNKSPDRPFVVRLSTNYCINLLVSSLWIFQRILLGVNQHCNIFIFWIY